MNPCVSEEVLLSVYDGDASPEARAHVAKCQICTMRYEHLVKDLKLLGQVLRDPPPQPAPRPVPQPVVRRWFPLVVTSAATAGLVWGYMQWTAGWRLESSRPPLSTVRANEVRDEDLARFFSQAVGPAVFSTMELGVTDFPERATNLAYVRAALDGGWPQERCSGEQTRGCENDPFALLFDEEEH
ncbi:MAG: hypothetical protein FJ147_05090 [Deltaproteobacteria bacterium]|nr:hypothetical protein [Deltaproteobacteria bacterium]